MKVSDEGTSKEDSVEFQPPPAKNWVCTVAGHHLFAISILIFKKSHFLVFYPKRLASDSQILYCKSSKLLCHW
jgi:hypothetical protein